MGKGCVRFHKGTHLVSTIEASENLKNHSGYLVVVANILTQVNLTLISESHHIFDNQSFTSSILLAESHINIHTWPEYNQAYLDIFVCSLNRDNSDSVPVIYDEVCKFFHAETDNVTVIKR